MIIRCNNKNFRRGRIKRFKVIQMFNKCFYSKRQELIIFCKKCSNVIVDLENYKLGENINADLIFDLQDKNPNIISYLVAINCKDSFLKKKKCKNILFFIKDGGGNFMGVRNPMSRLKFVDYQELDLEKYLGENELFSKNLLLEVDIDDAEKFGRQIGESKYRSKKFLKIGVSQIGQFFKSSLLVQANLRENINNAILDFKQNKQNKENKKFLEIFKLIDENDYIIIRGSKDLDIIYLYKVYYEYAIYYCKLNKNFNLIKGSIFDEYKF